ncbi:MAG: hypothetical protein EBS05_11765 [Proteobacteria bacterium]|nr:hypothetical protein [Pseudomonadota bacterium]
MALGVCEGPCSRSSEGLPNQTLNLITARLVGCVSLTPVESPETVAVNKLLMRPFQIMLVLVVIAQSAVTLPACIWDSDTLDKEKRTSPKLAAAILGGPPPPADIRGLRARIEKLKAMPRESDPNWWNDLAGAHLRLGEAADAIRLLEPIVTKFPDNYGIHANLGTAYHLSGRYADAERHIARDLEINPDAHFGLERYHLALLQYLVRDSEFQKAHLYVDECSGLLGQNWIARHFYFSVDREQTASDKTSLPNDAAMPVNYRNKWNLLKDPHFEKGVIYMATLNPQEPACYTMLGVACLMKSNEDLHLAVAAFKRAIELGSPQRHQLEDWVMAIEKHVGEATKNSSQPQTLALAVSVACILILIAGLYLKIRKRSLR